MLVLSCTDNSDTKQIPEEEEEEKEEDESLVQFCSVF